ncbi:hypothetical protein LRQ11_02280 [Pseudomonas sp. MAFF 311095]|uniref:Uncharacterized protein n=1 Tax=Pseudomonas petroselini TaxID=2899822 RepID=A0ABS8QMU1_9PSED|nr:hypothetical protein [Pseudomonas petroselini]MCD7036831.1 hypothetical protein [Pseudomonas petroselini]MCD7045259.1 hypothetical protein [Pseudomonas petroselini]MCD7070647.1 hypothetical protein [Pseudomonas petroselini]MCD7077808.1 hypothetical protein [Pseudomonas petroselini]
MKLKPSTSIIQGLLFTYCVENTKNPDREEFIATTNINDDKELEILFNKLTKPEFVRYKVNERQRHIKNLEHLLKTDENFESVFHLFDTHFDDEIVDKRRFMEVLLKCLKQYHKEATLKNPTSD